MRVIDGFITDKLINDSGYCVFEIPAEIGVLYSLDIQCGAEVRTYVKNLPSFDEVFNSFLV